MKPTEKQATKDIGKKIRSKRKELQISQKNLGEILNVTFQQVQKYENGLNRISPAKLKILCNVFNVESKYFYEDILYSKDEQLLINAYRKINMPNKSYLKEVLAVLIK